MRASIYRRISFRNQHWGSIDRTGSHGYLASISFFSHPSPLDQPDYGQPSGHLALGMEPIRDDVMKQKPKPKEEGIFAHGYGIRIVLQGIYVRGSYFGRIHAGLGSYRRTGGSKDDGLYGFWPYLEPFMPLT